MRPFLALLLSLCFLPPSTPALSAAEKPSTRPAKHEKTRRPGKGDEAKRTDEKKEKDDGKKPFDEVVQDADLPFEGLFRGWKKDGKLLLEVAPEHLDRNWLLIGTLDSGIGARGVLAGLPLDVWLVTLRRVDDRIQFLRRQVEFRSARSPEVGKELQRCFTDSVWASLKVESKPHPERKSVLVDAGPLFLGDLFGVGRWLTGALGAPYRLDADRTSYGRVQAFPANFEVQAAAVYTTDNPPRIGALADPRSVLVRVHYSLTLLPEDGFRPRLADDRMGHFLTSHMEFSDDRRESAWVRIVNRWKLEKADPALPVSPPREAIVFWLENTIPPEYREAIRDGVLLWNKAFEKAGFRDAIQVKIQPDDATWDPADVRYNTIRWISSAEASFGAIGPSRVNPLTGQILDADILIESEIVRGIRRSYRNWVEPVRGTASFPAPGEATWLPPALDPAHLCTLGPQAMQEGAFGALFLDASGAPGTEGDPPPSFVHDYLEHIAAHEVGHTLGLRHNFAGSTLHDAAALQDAALTARVGLTASVMDYTPVNLAPRGSRQGQYWSTAVGPWDEWTIEYAYRPIEARTPEAEIPVLREIASRAPEPGLAYGTDEDAFHFSSEPYGVDPRVNAGDLGADPLQFARTRAAIVRDLWGRLPGAVARPGDPWHTVRGAFALGFSVYEGSMHVAAKYVGGLYSSRDHIGDPNGRRPFAPVPAARQEEALRFLVENAFAEEPFRFPAELVESLGPNRFGEGTDYARPYYSIPARVLAMQAALLDRFTHPVLLARILDSAPLVPAGAKAFGLERLFGTLTEGIWGEALRARPGVAPANVTTLRRNLQREHLRRLTGLLLEPRPGTPEDARSLARTELGRLERAIRTSIASPALDGPTRAHWEESLARIREALEAQAIRRS